MRYKMYYEPMYENECLFMLRYIINGKSLKTDRDEMIKKRGSRYKSIVTRYFKKAIALEDYVRKNLKYNIPGYEETGKQMADFLFMESEGRDYIFADIIFAYHQHKQRGIDNKEFNFIFTIDGDCFTKHFGDNPDPLPVIESNKEFFMLLDECSASYEDKLNGIRLYYKFELYHEYFAALVSHVKLLIQESWPTPNDEVTAFMNSLAARFDSEGEKYFLDNFNVGSLDDDMLHVYPSLYRVNSLTLWATYYTDISVFFSLHIADIVEFVKNTDDNTSQAESFLKCLSDNTKLSILKLLKDGPMYGSQLAEKLECTSANISHHMSALISLDLITIEKQNNRVYFNLNGKNIIRYLDDAKGLFS